MTQTDAEDAAEPKGAPRALVLLGAVLVLGGACVGAIALYGRALTESDAAVGTLASPEERAARMAEAHRVFVAMSPAEHVAAAEHELACGYVAADGVGGNMAGAESHLAAVPAGGPEAARVAALRAEMAARRERSAGAAAVRVTRFIAEHPVTTATSDDDRAALRHQLAHRLDHLARLGVGCVHGEGDGDRTLRFDHGACDAAMLDRLTPAGVRPGLRALGFTQVRCGRGGASYAP